MMKKRTGIFLLIIGGILIAWGYDISGAVGSRLNEIFTGSPPDKAMYLYIGGAVCVLAGLFRIFRR